MRVLVVHNRYRSDHPSGENRVVDAEIQGLREAGVDVATYLRSSDEIAEYGPADWMRLATEPVLGRKACADVARIIDGFRPHVMHLHNPYPLISPEVIRVAKRQGVRVVHTVHNYRQVCVKGTFFRDGRVCEDCRGKILPWPAVVHACYRDSRSQSVAMATALTRHRSTWFEVDLFLAVSDFVADHLAREGIPRDHIRVKHNPVPDPGPPTSGGDGFLFVGRLDTEKGVLLLLDAWANSGLGDRSRLTLIGTGPLESAVREREASLTGVCYLGQVDSGTVAQLMRDHAVVVVPSIWYEGFPTTIIEAFAHGRPVLATNLGSLAQIVDDDVGWLTLPELGALTEALRLAASETKTRDRSANARKRYRDGKFHDPIPELITRYESLLKRQHQAPN